MLGAVSFEEIGGPAGPYGDIAAMILSTAGSLAQGAVEAGESSDQAQKASAADQAKLFAAVTSDVAAATAIAQSLTSDVLAAGATGKAKAGADAKAKSAAIAMNTAIATDMSTAALLPASQVNARMKAIADASSAAAAKLQKDPKNPFSQSLVKAWDKVAAIARGEVASTPGGGSARGVEEAGILSTRLFGTVKLWHAGVGAGVLGLGALAVKRGLFGRMGA